MLGDNKDIRPFPTIFMKQLLNNQDISPREENVKKNAHTHTEVSSFLEKGIEDAQKGNLEVVWEE